MPATRSAVKGSYASPAPDFDSYNKDPVLHVVTPYGPGWVLRTRRSDGMQEIELWKQNDDKSMNSNNNGRRSSSMLYSLQKYVSAPVTEGCDVLCFAGRGRVVQVRKEDASDSPCAPVKVRLSNWRLANRSRVYCYVSLDAVQVVRPKMVYEMSVPEKIERAQEYKDEAAQLFQTQNYAAAYDRYSRAVETVRYVQHNKSESTNIVRADLLVVMITCSNNAATCCWKLDRIEQAAIHARDASLLLDALEPKRGQKIYQELLSAGYSDEKVFGEWKVKSLLILAKTEMAQIELDACLASIQRARDTVCQYSNNNNNSTNKILQGSDRELVKLLKSCKEHRKVQRQKEKQRAQAMFAATTEHRSAVSAERKKSDPCSSSSSSSRVSSPRSVENFEGSGPEPKISDRDKAPAAKNVEKVQPKASKSVRFHHSVDDPDIEDEVPWHQDAAFLSGLGVVFGVVGAATFLLWRSTRSSK
jgi:hypothetical protein